MKSRSVKQTGFTIVELLIVIVIIAILAAISIFGYNGVQARSRDAARDSAAKTIRTALELYRTEEGQYPHVCSAVNTGCNASLLSTSLVPKYTGNVPVDPSQGVPIHYVVNAAQDGYGLRVMYEKYGTTGCKYLGGSNPSSGWWGSSVPVCS